MVVVEVEVWMKAYAVDVEVEAEWMDDLLEESIEWLAEQHFTADYVPSLHRHLKEVQSMDYTLVPILHDF